MPEESTEAAPSLAELPIPVPAEKAFPFPSNIPPLKPDALFAPVILNKFG
ncbi:hypothetical protein NT04LM_3409, partial [Listeria monocytogenes FSL F2-208]